MVFVRLAADDLANQFLLMLCHRIDLWRHSTLKRRRGASKTRQRPANPSELPQLGHPATGAPSDTVRGRGWFVGLLGPERVERRGDTFASVAQGLAVAAAQRG